MATLLDALEQLGIPADVDLGGRWVAIRGEHGAAYVIEAVWGSAFYVWCSTPEERTVQRHTNAVAAIQDAIRRAGGPPHPGSGKAGPEPA